MELQTLCGSPTGSPETVPLEPPIGHAEEGMTDFGFAYVAPVLNGDLDEILNALITADQAERLKQVK